MTDTTEIRDLLRDLYGQQANAWRASDGRCCVSDGLGAFGIGKAWSTAFEALTHARLAGRREKILRATMPTVVRVKLLRPSLHPFAEWISSLFEQRPRAGL